MPSMGVSDSQDLQSQEKLQDMLPEKLPDKLQELVRLKVKTDSLGLSFDDVLLEPGYSQVLPNECRIASNLGPIELRVPIISAAMDTVTEARTAIALALLGGFGVLHKNMTPDEQAHEVKRVKKFQHAVIGDPLTIRADQSVREVEDMVQETGVTGFPVIDSRGVLVGMCTGRDIRFVTDYSLKVIDVMSAPAKSLTVGATHDQALEFFKKYKVEKLPLVDKEGRLMGLMTSKDTRVAKDSPDALRDRDGALFVAAAIGTGDKEAYFRSEALVAAGVNCLVVDSAHGHSEGVLSTLRILRKKYPEMILIGGNVATADGAVALVEAGADVVKVGMGPGSICTTRIVSGAGVPQLTAVLEVAARMRKDFPKVGVIADGGIRFSGDVTKALAAGAHAVMLGSMFAGTEESPGDTILYMGRSYKSYRGMGSLGAMKRGSRDRYFQGKVQDQSKLVPEGVEARVPYRGKIKQVIYQLVGGLRSGMGYVGARDLVELYAKSRFRQITNTSLRESHVHDVAITSESPNYSGGSFEES
jgi:IMP dehydrogenase